MNENICCVFGHRKIDITNNLRIKLYNIIEELIVENKVDTFLLGSKSQFDDLCHQTISELKAFYPHIRRIYVRAQFPYINDNYMQFLLQNYEDTYYPESIIKAGRLAYVERNYEMINRSKYCIVYFDENYVPTTGRRKQSSELTNSIPESGTKIAFDYALKKGKIIINLFNEIKIF